MLTGMIGLAGVIIGAVISLLGVNSYIHYLKRKERRLEDLDLKMKEIDALMLLNKKINEILLKRTTDIEYYQSFDSFDDCYISLDDYIYLQTFCAMNHYYLPNYLVEEFFKDIAHRQVVMSPDETVRLGAYTYKGGKLVLENFSEELTRCIEDAKVELKQIRNRE